MTPILALGAGAQDVGGGVDLDEVGRVVAQDAVPHRDRPDGVFERIGRPGDIAERDVHRRQAGRVRLGDRTASMSGRAVSAAPPGGLPNARLGLSSPPRALTMIGRRVATGGPATVSRRRERSPLGR